MNDWENHSCMPLYDYPFWPCSQRYLKKVAGGMPVHGLLLITTKHRPLASCRISEHLYLSRARSDHSPPTRLSAVL